MPSGKTVKLILYEALQFTAFIVPVFVIFERFARLIHNVKGQDLTTYWLVVAVSTAYVTSASLLVWVPLKYMILKRRFLTEITQRPTVLVYLMLCTFPCFAILITSSKVQVDGGHCYDHFAELPVSLVLFSLICVDIIEQIRPCRLTGQPSAAYLYSLSAHPQSHSGPLGFLWRRDGRSQVFMDTFLFWLDTVEMVRVAGEPSVYYSGWVFPVYILAFLSTLRIAITPHNPLLSSAGVALQDLPFFIIRVALIIVFGYVTPLLYPLKNVLVSLTYIYFTFLTKLRIFRSHSMF
uniref:Uncharacterized protein n=1 Tax=Monopterus albus TaxID=43700 RepID=A0A3Q3K545_MONAL